MHCVSRVVFVVVVVVCISHLCAYHSVSFLDIHRGVISDRGGVLVLEQVGLDRVHQFRGVFSQIDAIGLLHPQSIGSQNGVEFGDRGQFRQNAAVCDTDGKGQNVEGLVTDSLSGFQAELFLVQRAGDLGCSILVTNDSLRQDKGLLVRTHVLSGVPFPALFVVEDRQLRVSVENGCSNVGEEIRNGSDVNPALLRVGKDVVRGGFPVGLACSVLGPIGGAELATHVNEFQHVVLVDGFFRVGELLVQLSQLWVLDDLRPFVVVGFDQ
mmetsp:Transcript_9018/g.19463  ORF Transcript_9018/g.19463 Transcript_9018/m.19463 type:complete len:268 (-) Transcript_9018:1926-2729(-)